MVETPLATLEKKTYNTLSDFIFIPQCVWTSFSSLLCIAIFLNSGALDCWRVSSTIAFHDLSSISDQVWRKWGLCKFCNPLYRKKVFVLGNLLKVLLWSSLQSFLRTYCNSRQSLSCKTMYNLNLKINVQLNINCKFWHWHKDISGLFWREENKGRSIRQSNIFRIKLFKGVHYLLHHIWQTSSPALREPWSCWANIFRIKFYKYFTDLFHPFAQSSRRQSLSRLPDGCYLANISEFPYRV